MLRRHPLLIILAIVAALGIAAVSGCADRLGGGDDEPAQTGPATTEPELVAPNAPETPEPAPEPEKPKTSPLPDLPPPGAEPPEPAPEPKPPGKPRQPTATSL
jgi:outer membrane biosynthesis protein TonB